MTGIAHVGIRIARSACRAVIVEVKRLAVPANVPGGRSPLTYASNLECNCAT